MDGFSFSFSPVVRIWVKTWAKALQVAVQDHPEEDDIFQINQTHVPLKTIQDPLHQVLESGESIGQSQRHDLELVENYLGVQKANVFKA